MSDRELVKNIVEFAFLIKAQLSSDETALLRSALAIVIMEAEDVLELMENSQQDPALAAQDSSDYACKEA